MILSWLAAGGDEAITIQADFGAAASVRGIGRATVTEPSDGRRSIISQGGIHMTKKNAPDAKGRTKTGIGRRDFLKTAAGGALVAGSFPLVNVARADSNVIKIGVIDLITGPRGAFGEAGPWV